MSPWLDFLINGVLFWLCMSSLALNAYNLLVHRDVPNIRSAPAIRKKIIALLKEDCEKRQEKAPVIVDLGAGNGLLTREIAKALPQAKVIGVEITRHSVLWANWRKRREKLENLEYKRMNFFDYDFSEASAFVVYTIPFYMHRIGKKLHEEARPGTLIISNKFELGDGWKACQTMRVKTLYFHQGDLHVYRKTAAEQAEGRTAPTLDPSPALSA